MAITKATSSVLADNAALNNLNAGASIAFTKPVSLSGNLTVDTNTLFVDSVNNRVGIGTTTPAYSLDIIGRGGFSNGLIMTGSPTSLSDINYIQGLNSATTVGFLAGTGTFRSFDGPYFAARGNTYSAISNQRGMVFFAAGAVSSPTGNEGTISFSTTPAAGTNESIRLLINRDGNVGIGTTTPSTPLYIYTAGNNSVTIEAGTGDSQVALRSGGSQRFLFGYEDADDGFRIYNYATTSTALFVKSNTGNVGIGTTSPAEKLSVSGNISATGNVTASNLVYTTGDQTIAGLKTFSDNIVGNGTANRLPNQLAVTSSDIITKGLADSRYTSRNERITDDTTFVQTTWEQFLDFDDQYNQDLNVVAASGATTFGASPVFGDTWVANNVYAPGFTGNDLYTHRGVFLVRGPTANSQAFYIGINRTTIPYSLTNRVDEFTSRVFINGADFATQGYFKIGPIPKGGTGGSDTALRAGLIFNPFLHPTNFVLGTYKSTTVTPFTFTTTAANVDFLDTGFNFTDLINKWVNITYKIDRAVGPTITIIITRDNVVLFQASYNTATHPTISTWNRRGELYATGASNEIGLQSGHFTYTSPNRSQLFIDYLYYKVTGTSAAPSNWNSLRF